ncbi:MAG TPA: gamma-glutamyl-gamma-aminobutyrate hydrolase family protein [Phnomibacter sp.]|nr:gamma-glutamyl-gamma-aminobutyrate hydrolase family protein [Phnomibacter sp.]
MMQGAPHLTQVTIGITNGIRYEYYEQWMLQHPGVKVLRLGYQFAPLEALHQCQGLLLSGGHDVHPQYYGMPHTMERLSPEYVDAQRDAYELALLEQAVNRGMPLLAICRGMQLLNVWLGGTLVTDLPTDLGLQGHGRSQGQDARHGITLLPGSHLLPVCGTSTGTINSAHHQAVASLGNGLVPGAVAQGTQLPESIQWANPQGKPWLLAVQWHPERMPDQQNPFAGPIGNAFVAAVRQAAA